MARRRHHISRIPFFKYLLFFTGTCMVFGVYWRVYIMSEGLDVMHKVCDCDDFRADTSRISGLVEGDAEAILGTWRYERSIEQYKSWSGRESYRYEGYRFRSDEGEAVHFGNDTLYNLIYPYSKKEQRWYSTKEDSILYEPIDKWEREAYSINEAIRFKEDTLVLISARNGFCKQTLYQFYTRVNDSAQHVQQILINKVNWDIFTDVWENKRYSSDDESIAFGPRFLDLRERNKSNFSTKMDTLFYYDHVNEKTYIMCFNEAPHYMKETFPTLRFGDHYLDTDISYVLLRRTR
ncbi:MAG: hypothetical protein GQ574_13235 [Crocinitomix sp.]|nr:hypothetical protein [Crocinitomix sp.]